jgi:SAM-dependent methyltransferase
VVRTVETLEVTGPDVWGTTSRRLLTRHIIGSGLELGPGHVPFPAAPGTSVRIVDRCQPEENQVLFAELEDAEFARPDIVADLNTERLHALSDASQDFVICSHVLEHLAEPIGLLDDMHRVLRPGGVALVLLPDRRRTFDRFRTGTPLAHLVAEYESGVSEVDDQHILDFLTTAVSPSAPAPEPPIWASPAERRGTIDLHRKRSVHVHCWDDTEFVPVLLYGIEHLGWRWEFVDGKVADDDGASGIEFGFVLRVSTAEVTSAARRERFYASWHLWHEDRLGRLEALTTAQRRAAAAVDAAAADHRRLERIDRSLPMRLYQLGKRATRRR